jgi:O-antigen ligase
MASASARREELGTAPSDWLFLALIFAVPLMKPAVSGEMIVADLLFLLLAAAAAIETLIGRRKLRWLPSLGALLAYVVSLAPSLLATSDMGASLFKFSTEFYLIGLAAAGAYLVDSEADLRRAVLVWLAATALVCAVGLLGLAAFATGSGGWLLDYSSFGFGSLVPGDYPRLSLTFFNANMACNYLTCSLGLLLIARIRGYAGRVPAAVMAAAIGIAAASTISPGLGGIALVAGVWIWLALPNHAVVGRLALAGGAAVAALFVLALTFTIFPHSTAPFRIDLPLGLTLYPSGRYLTWSGALAQFLRHPLIGIGIGIPPDDVHFMAPMGMQELTDAHNLFLSIGAQCGIVGLIGLTAIIGFAAAQLRSGSGTDKLTRFVLASTFLNALVYQGIGGSFEDTRHIWLLLGLLMAAVRLEATRPDGNSRTPSAP